MRSFATVRGASTRQSLVRVVLGAVLVAVLVWMLPERRAGEVGGHHGTHAPVAPALDPFERAGISELKEGQRGPAFRLAGLDGRPGSLDDWRDKLVVLNFWATWCTPCTLEMPTLEALWRRYRARGLVVLGISVDRGPPRHVIDPYLASLKLTFPILLDPTLEAAGRWRVTALPATFIVKPGGEVAGMAIGPREWDSADMTALLETMLPAPP